MVNVLAGLATALNVFGDIFGIGDTIKGASTYAKWKAFDFLQGNNYWAGLFSSIEDAETSALLPISPAGIGNIARSFVDSMCLLRIALDPELADELIGEMLSEGLSSAMETNVAGALQTILNVHRGSLPPDISDVNTLAQIIDRADYLHLQAIALMCGSNPPAITNALLLGADQRYREMYNPFIQQYLTYQQLLNDYLSEPLTALRDILNQIFNRLVNLHINKMDELESYLKDIANEHIARINQIHDNFEADYMNYATNVIDYETAVARFIRQKIQAETTKQVFLDWYYTLMQKYDELLNEIRGEFDNIINDIWQYIVAGEKRHVDFLQMLKDALDDDDLASAIASRIVELHKDVNAYRETEQVYMVGSPATIG